MGSRFVPRNTDIELGIFVFHIALKFFSKYIYGFN